MIEIKCGPELDFAVARAIGLKDMCLSKDCVLVTSCDWDEMRGIEHFTTEGPIACKRFTPSTDLNAAFAAAEKVTRDAGRWGIQRVGIKWLVDFCLTNPGNIVLGKGIFADDSTPALAICAAILKLSEEKEASMTD